VPGVARSIVVAVKEERASLEIARGPQPEELVEIALGRRLRLACPHRPDAPAPVARARPAVADRDALAIDRQPARPAPVLRHARVVHEHSRAVAADEAWLLDRKMASGKGQLAGKRTIAGRDPERQN